MAVLMVESRAALYYSPERIDWIARNWLPHTEGSAHYLSYEHRHNPGRPCPTDAHDSTPRGFGPRSPQPKAEDCADFDQAYHNAGLSDFQLQIMALRIETGESIKMIALRVRRRGIDVLRAYWAACELMSRYLEG